MPARGDEAAHPRHAREERVREREEREDDREHRRQVRVRHPHHAKEEEGGASVAGGGVDRHQQDRLDGASDLLDAPLGHARRDGREDARDGVLLGGEHVEGHREADDGREAEREDEVDGIEQPQQQRDEEECRRGAVLAGALPRRPQAVGREVAEEGRQLLAQLSEGVHHPPPGRGELPASEPRGAVGVARGEAAREEEEEPVERVSLAQDGRVREEVSHHRRHRAQHLGGVTARLEQLQHAARAGPARVRLGERCDAGVDDRPPAREDLLDGRSHVVV
mmetsp:Transcript_17602/g.57736  ORF Transcript_17602/g.57736 Transcript_17602/m.57736 type:complete len:279 (-) Transcript_17602:635-1471(-)